MKTHESSVMSTQNLSQVLQDHEYRMYLAKTERYRAGNERLRIVLRNVVALLAPLLGLATAMYVYANYNLVRATFSEPPKKWDTAVVVDPPGAIPSSVHMQLDGRSAPFGCP